MMGTENQCDNDPILLENAIISDLAILSRNHNVRQ